MDIVLKTKTSEETSPVLALFASKDLDNHPFYKQLEKTDREYVKEVAKSVEYEKENYRLLFLPSSPKRGLILLGLGVKNDWDRRKFILTARKIVGLLKEAGIKNASINLDDYSFRGTELSEILDLFSQNLLMADFTFTSHKERPKGGWPKIETVEIRHGRISKKLEDSLMNGIKVGEAVNECRNLSNTPGGIMTPAKLADSAKKMADKTPGVKIKILSELEIKKLSMGGVMGVSQGSSERPKFIILEYGPAKKKPLVFVGKGVTFDTGGINLKPGESSLGMHMDMSGGSAVIHAVEAIANLKLPVRVVGLIPAVENMPSGSSYRPGDILKTYKGKTIEVLNTDAEGRVILADGLGYAQDYEPQLIVDVATLTGAVVVALGQRITGLFSNQEKLLNLGKKIGEKTGDYMWPMPAWDEYEEEIKGTFGDVANSGKTRYGGAITAAVFLKQFVGDYPWIHLDIASTMTTIDGQNLSKGASGAGVRFLVELAKEYSKK